MWEKFGRATGVTFLGKSEHMRYINFGKFYIEKTKKILKIFQTAFFHLSKEKEKWLGGVAAGYPILLRTASVF